MLNDLRYAFRMLLKSPGFTVVAVLTLALGIGANTAIFTLVDAVLLRPLPFRDPERLVMIWESAPEIGFPRNEVAPANFADWKAQNQAFEDMAALRGRSVNLTGDGDPEKIEAIAVTANSFSLLGVKPTLGRVFLPEEDRPEATKVTLIGYGLWQRRFGGDPGLVGKDVLLDGEKFTVVGIMPPYFQFLGKDLWVPLAFSPGEWANRGAHYLAVVARLKDGIKLKQAQAELETITRRIAQDHPIDAYKLRAYLLPLREQLAGEVRPALIVLLLAVGCVLLIACGNIANLQLSRATARNREIAVRTALGAGRGRIVRQLLTESVLLAGLGGLAGLLVAEWSFTFLQQLIPESMALSTQVRIDAQVLGYALLISLVTGVIFGVAPAAQAAKVDLNQSLKQSAGRTTLGGGGKKLRGSLVVAEVALSFALLVGAGLLIQTFVRLRHLDPGFRPENLLVVNTTLPQRKYAELPKRGAFYQQVLERVKALPGVISAAYTTAVPLTWKGGTNGFSIEGRSQMPGQDANHRQISPNYFQTLGIPLRRGRFFDEHDGPQSMPVAIINETTARQFWPDEDALGKRFKLGPPDSSDPWWTIVGIVGDVKQMGLEVPVKAEMYFPYQQMATGFFFFAPQSLAIRTAGDPASLAAAVRREVWGVDPNQPVSDITTMEDILESEVAQRRSGMALLAAFATLALLLASLGIYGVLSYAVTLRTPEIGVRLALGAQPGDVWRMVVREGLGLAFLGVGLGLTVSFALTRFLASLLFNVSATDVRTFASVSLLLTSVAFVATYLPARRAAKVDPMVALRYE